MARQCDHCLGFLVGMRPRALVCVFVCIKKPGPVFLLKIIVHASLERDLTLGSPSPIPNDDDDDADD
jgi:hypothetical protein